MSDSLGLQYYNNHTEKKQYFTLHVIESDSDFRNLFKELLPSKYKRAGIWRGTQESSFKLYNTFQRENLQIKEPVLNVLEYIRQLEIKFDAWDSKNIVPKFFRNFGIDHIPLYAKLSILRHYGVPLPLLDWTRNPNVAMYFATQSNKVATKKRNLEDYFSIYFIDKEHPFYQFNSKLGAELYESNSLSNIGNRHKIFGHFFASRKKVNSMFNSSKFIYKSMNDHPIQRISDEEGDHVNHLTLSNFNITAQNGLFVLNMHPKLPLEEAILHRAKMFAPSNSFFQEAYRRHKQNFICFDIHKKFIPEIRKMLQSENVNVTEHNIHLDFNQLKKDLSFESLINM